MAGGGSSEECTGNYMYPAIIQHRLRKLILVKVVKEGGATLPMGAP